MNEERELVHQRRIETQGFRRKDGLWDIDAYLLDTKGHDFINPERHMKPGDYLHEIFLRLTLDDDFLILDVKCAFDASPFGICKEAALLMDKLKGLRIGKDFVEEARNLVGGMAGCTHLFELLIGPLATTAYQTLWPAREAKAALDPNRKRPAVIGQCHALNQDGDVVGKIWPQFAKKIP